MKIILLPIFKYTLSFSVGVYILILTLLFYPIAVIWEFKLMSWGDYMEYNYTWGTNYQVGSVSKMLREESFFGTMKRWINFEYAIIYELI